MRFKHIFLDLDGTISDSAPGMLNGVRYMLNRAGITKYDDKDIYRLFGPPVVHSLEKIYGLNREAAERAYKHFQKYYISRGVYENTLYKGAMEMIDALNERNLKIYIATAKHKAAAMIAVRHLKIEDRFDGIFSADPDNNIYFKQDILQSAIDQLSFTPKKAVMVGDRAQDIAAGKAHRFSTVGVLYGYGEAEEIEKAAPDHTVKTVKELTHLLLQ